jgi:DNA-binding LacI/PurR family transcriptional regulator
MARNSDTSSRPGTLIKRITMAQVGALSGVSYQTVSRVVNGMPDVANTTRERVLKVMSEVGYRPNVTARQLVSQRSSVIGVVTFGTGLYGPTQIMVNLEQSVKEIGWSVMFCGIAEESANEIRRAVNELCSHQVGGVLIHLPLEIDLRHLQDVCRNVPLVAIDSVFGFKAHSVFVNQEHGSRLVTRHLLSLGHTRIAYLRAPLIWRASRLRFRGFLKELKASNLKPGPVVEADWSAHGGFEAVSELLSTKCDPFTSLIGANDQMALGAIRAFEEAGIRVPAKVSVAGFDDIPEAGYLRPPLTTVRQDFVSLGKLSVRCLLDQLDNPKRTPRNRTIRPTLVQRESTAPVPT